MSHQPDLSRELRLWADGFCLVAGLDEAGRGAWAGPVVAAAVILPPECPDTRLVLQEVRDSKLLTPRARDRCFDLIVEHALSYGIGAAPAQTIDEIGIVPSTRLAMAHAISKLIPPPDHLLIDALYLPHISLPQLAMPKGDRYCLSIAAASILAKVTRDRELVAQDDRWCGYGLARHKGYGTRQHRQALSELGPTPYHRHSFRPIRELDEAIHG